MKRFNPQFFTTKKLYIEHVWLMITLPIFIVFGIWAIQFSVSSPVTYVSAYEVMPKEMFSQIHDAPKEHIGSYVLTSDFEVNIQVLDMRGFREIFSGVGEEIHYLLPEEGLYLIKYIIKIGDTTYLTTRRKKVVKDCSNA